MGKNIIRYDVRLRVWIQVGKAPTREVRLGASGIPADCALSQNYPNPFNPSTRFTVAVPNNSLVDVSVYDILGRKIATLLTGEIPAGSYPLEWKGLNDRNVPVAGGVYFLRMSSGSFVATKKMIMIK